MVLFITYVSFFLYTVGLSLGHLPKNIPTENALKYPFAVELCANETSIQGHVGIGVLVAPEWVLVPAEACEFESLYVRVGSPDIEQGKEIKIKRKIIHDETEILVLLELESSTANCETCRPIEIADKRPKPLKLTSAVSWHIGPDFESPIKKTIEEVPVKVLSDEECLNSTEVEHTAHLFHDHMVYCGLLIGEGLCETFIIELGALIISDNKLSGLHVMQVECEMDEKIPFINMVYYKKWIESTCKLPV